MVSVQNEAMVTLIMVGYFSNFAESGPQGMHRKQVSLSPGTDLHRLLTEQNINLEEVGLVTIDGRLENGNPLLRNGALVRVFPSVGGG